MPKKCYGKMKLKINFKIPLCLTNSTIGQIEMVIYFWIYIVRNTIFLGDN